MVLVCSIILILFFIIHLFYIRFDVYMMRYHIHYLSITIYPIHAIQVDVSILEKKIFETHHSDSSKHFQGRIPIYSSHEWLSIFKTLPSLYLSISIITIVSTHLYLKRIIIADTFVTTYLLSLSIDHWIRNTIELFLILLTILLHTLTSLIDRLIYNFESHLYVH